MSNILFFSYLFQPLLLPISYFCFLFPLASADLFSLCVSFFILIYILYPANFHCHSARYAVCLLKFSKGNVLVFSFFFKKKVGGLFPCPGMLVISFPQG
jgi:hypothetical protein